MKWPTDVVLTSPKLAALMGGVAEGVVLAYVVWRVVEERDDQITDDEVREATGVSDRELRRAKKRMKDLPFLRVQRKNMPARTHYEVNPEQFENAMEEHQYEQ